MNIQDCYEAFHGDYAGVLGRLRKPELVQKFVLKFLSDPTFSQLCQAYAARDAKEAFRAAHTLKGVCQNLGFDMLYQDSSELAEALRNGEIPADQHLLLNVQRSYNETFSAIASLSASLEV